MAPKKPKPATDSIIGRRVRINADATYANGNTHAWAGFTGTVRVHNGRSVYQVEMEDGQAIEVFPLDSFSLLHDAHVDGQADGGVDASAGADQLTTPTPAAASPAVPDTGELAMLEIAYIVRSKTNPRKHFDADALAELAASIKLQGVAQPILVRPLPASRVQETAENRLPGEPLPTHELVAGERRYRACKQAGVKAVPALIRHLTDTQVLELQLVENLKRSDLHPMEEAEGYEALMQQAGMTADQIADRIGKSKSYVYKSLKLLDLSPNSRTAFYDGKISASVALLVARHIEQHQAEILKEFGKTNYYDEPISFRRAQDWIHAHYMLKLNEAPFKITDATLVPTAGSCRACPKRTGANPDLFNDVKAADTCTDKACFEIKRSAHIERLKAEAKAKGQTLITGKEAKEIIPSQYQDPKGYKLLDQKEWMPGLGESTTLRKVLGRDLPDVVLVENPHTKELQAMLPTPVVNRMLKEKGMDGGRSPERNAELEKAKAESKYQNGWRKQAFKAAYEQAQTLAANSAPLPDHIELTLRLSAEAALARFYNNDDRKLLAQVLGVDSPVALKDALEKFVEGAPANQVQAIALVLSMWDDLEWVSSSAPNVHAPKLTTLAEYMDIDLDTIKKEVQADMREAAAAKAKPITKAESPTKADKPARKPKTTAAQASAQIAAAMQAAEADGAAGVAA